MQPQLSTGVQMMDVGVRRQEDAEAARVLGWLLLLFDAIPMVFIWVGLRTGSDFWLWWTVIEGAAGVGALGKAGIMFAQAERLLGQGLQRRAEEERAAAGRLPRLAA